LASDDDWKGRMYYLTEDGSKDLIKVMGVDARVDKRLWIPPVSIALLLVFVSFPRIQPLEWHPLQTLEIPWTDLAYTLAHLGFALLLITELSRLRVCWNEFRRLLSALDRLQLRRAFRQLKGFSWKWLWSLGGGSAIHSHRAMAREREALLHLRLLLGTDKQEDPMLDNPGSTLERLLVEARSEPTKMLDFDWTRKVMVAWAALQSGLAHCCREELKTLYGVWKEEKDTDMFHDVDPDQKGPDPKVPEDTQRREQFVALVYVNFMVSVMLRMRTIMMTVAGLYVFLLLSISFYPVEPMVFVRPLLILLFFVIIAVVGVVYAQMHKDPILSRLTDTTPGELGLDFYVKMGTFVFLPLVSLLVSQFPDVNNFLLSWLTPAMQALNH